MGSCREIISSKKKTTIAIEAESENEVKKKERLI